VALSVAMVAFGVASVAALYLVFVRTGPGQRLDQESLLRVDADPHLTRDIARVLNDLSIGLGIAVLVACMAVALVRGQIRHAIAAAVLVGGANLTTQLLKHVWLTRPDFGFGTDNSLPSGHTTVAVSLTLAMLLVVPGFARVVVVLAGSVAASLVGVGLVVAGWHRPSDVVAALGVCLAWSGLVSLWLLLRSREPAPPRSPLSGRGHWPAALGGTVVVVALAYAFGLRPDGTWQDLAVHGFTVCAIALATALCLALSARVMPEER